MAKRLMAKVGQYEKNGETKGEYVEIGVILSNDKGEYAILSPTVDLAGVLMQQRILGQKNGTKVGDRVMCSIFENDRQGGQQGGGRQEEERGPVGAGGRSDYGDEIPFAPEWRA